MSILYRIRLWPIRIKGIYKERLFRKLAIMGPDVKIHAAANIKCDEKSSIIIRGHNDLLCVLTAQEGGIIEIGEFTTIRGYSVIGAVKSVKIGNHVIISNNVHIYDNNNHPTNLETRIKMCESGFYSHLWSWGKSESAEVVIEDNVWIGERSTILKGVTIGRGSVVGCDSVVTKSVPPYSVAAGNPAKVVKQLEVSEVSK